MNIGELHSLINRGLTMGDRIDALVASVERLTESRPAFGERVPQAGEEGVVDEAPEPTPAQQLNRHIDGRIADLEGPPEQIA
jgi:hypothetical protein